MAIDLLGSSIAGDPGVPACYLDLSHALQAANRIDDAIAAAGWAIDLEPEFAAAHLHLGTLFHGRGELRQALLAYRSALEIDPSLVPAATNLASTLNALGCHKSAEEAAQHALKWDPRSTAAANNLANAQCGQGRAAESLTTYRAALALDPENANLHYNYGIALEADNDIPAALEAYRTAVACRPDFAAARNNLGMALQAHGFLDAAFDEFTRAFQLEPMDDVIHSNLLLAAQYRPGVTLPQLADLHAVWRQRHVPSATITAISAIDCIPSRRLRVGFVSGDFGIHPVAHFVAPVVNRLAQHQLEVFCYAQGQSAETIATRPVTGVVAWRDLAGRTDERVLKQIRDDGIDILIDLSGHTGRNRLGLFTQRAAPVQASWLGYVGTTGVANMDYLICDRYQVPPGVESYYSEAMLRMPNGYVCFEPPAEAPVVAQLPAERNGYVTFGSFNNPAKLNAYVLATWARILKAVPHSRLLLKYRGLDWPLSRERVRKLFAEFDIGEDRVVLSGASSRGQLMAAYNLVDIGLDPFPYSGGLTTCEALWMGVPVITTPGQTFAGRHAFSHLSNAGFPEMVTRDLDRFVARAVELAGDQSGLREFRASARETMRNSPLCDLDGFASDFARQLQTAWETPRSQARQALGHAS